MLIQETYQKHRVGFLVGLYISSAEMVESGPLTPEQIWSCGDGAVVFSWIWMGMLVDLGFNVLVSFLLAFVPVFIARVYSEYLEYKKNSISTKVHSDNSLVKFGNETLKEDVRAELLEGGGLQSASPRAAAQSSSFMTHLFRFLLMDDSFLI